MHGSLSNLYMNKSNWIELNLIQILKKLDSNYLDWIRYIAYSNSWIILSYNVTYISFKIVIECNVN